MVEDDAEAATAMVRGLSEAGHEVTHAVDGAFGLLEAQKGGYDVYVVDRMMPRLDGVGMVEMVRKGGDQTPVLFLSALGEVEDRVTGLKAGADDYLVKPFHKEELIARVRALLRRSGGWSQAKLVSGPLVLDTSAQTLTLGDQPVELTSYEFRVLNYLLLHAGKVISKSELNEHLYAEDSERDSNVIEVFIRRLRSKIDPDGTGNPITTLRGAGYRWDWPRPESED